MLMDVDWLVRHEVRVSMCHVSIVRMARIM